MYRKTDIVFVNFPFSNGQQFKPRPALILSNSKVHKTGDYILVQITSRTWGDGLSMPLSVADYRGKPLPKNSEVRIHKLFTANNSLILSKITAVTRQFRKSVNGKLNQIIL